MDKRLLTVVLVAVLVALVITAIFYQITVGRRPAAAEAAMAQLVVAKADLDMGVEITDADLRVIDFPQAAYPAGGFETIDAVVNRSVVQPIMANEPITKGRVTEPGVGFGLAPMIPEGYRALAVAVNQVTGVSGFIIPGSKVDVILTGSVAESPERLSATVLENVTVLSTGHRRQADANGQPENVPVVNMLLTLEDAELMTLATQEGRIQLVLRNPTDEEKLAEDHKAKTTRDLFNMAPAPAPRPRSRPREIAQVQALPAPAPQIEMIRGNVRTLESLDGAEN